MAKTGSLRYQESPDNKFRSNDSRCTRRISSPFSTKTALSNTKASLERLYGFTQDELVGEQVAEYFHPDDREAVVDAFQSVVSSEEYTVEAVEYRHKKADGTYCWVESVASTNPTPEGYYVINTRDISDRKERQLQLERKNERLAEFATIVSHDLRNPLNIAQGSVERARRTCESESLDDVEWAHTRMEELIVDLLTLARSGNRITGMELVELAVVAESGWQNVVTVDATLVSETERTIRADRTRLQQLLENLIRNTVEHGGTDPTVTIGDLTGRDGFYIADDGPGIPDENRERVFEGGYSTSSDGTGLGLPIVEEIAHAHGWDIMVTSSESGGAQFEFTDVEGTQ